MDDAEAISIAAIQTSRQPTTPLRNRPLFMFLILLPDYFARRESSDAIHRPAWVCRQSWEFCLNPTIEFRS
jgi:hypothetical protein